MTKTFTIIAFAVILLTACTTPKYIMQHPKTGQVQTCGGNSNASFAGGIVGYNLQKKNDEKCVSDFTEQGFETIKVVEE